MTDVKLHAVSRIVLTYSSADRNRDTETARKMSQNRRPLEGRFVNLAFTDRVSSTVTWALCLILGVLSESACISRDIFYEFNA